MFNEAIIDAAPALQPNSGIAPFSARPETFLFPHWTGKGAIRDAFGIRYDEYRVEGYGELDEAGAPVIHYRIEFGKSGSSRHKWRIRRNTGRKIVATDLITGVNARGQVTETGWVWGAPGRIKTPLGVRLANIELAYTVLSDCEAETRVTVRLWGVTVGTAGARVRHVQGRPPQI